MLELCDRCIQAEIPRTCATDSESGALPFGEIGAEVIVETSSTPSAIDAGPNWIFARD